MKLKTSAKLYIYMIFAWLILLALSFKDFYYSFRGVGNNYVLFFLLIMNTLFICYFWLNGMKEIFYVFFYWKNKNKLIKIPRKKITDNPKVILLYCTCNDFNADSLAKSMKQKYSNFETYILDDSKDKEYIKKVNAFAKENNVKVIRRKDRIGFKAGNINHFLKGKEDYDYFVILDSDEVVPKDFIIKALKYFYSYKNIGILQANHISSRNINFFMKVFSRGVDSHWPTYQSVKHNYGFLSLLGHGAMVSKNCYKDTGGFPHVVAEDLCFSIEARMKGYTTAFAPNIICEEEYPVDYLAFKKRHLKWTQGNMEFIKTYTKRIMTSSLKWFEKLDIVLFTYSLPLTAFFGIYIILNLIVFPLLGYSLGYSPLLLIPTIVFLIAPMVNDIIYYSKQKIGALFLLAYSLLTFVLYGSMFYISLETSFKAILGKKAYFHVTPKTSKSITLREAFKVNLKEFIFGVILTLIAILLTKNFYAVILLVIPVVLAPILILMSNINIIFMKNIQSKE